MILLNHSHDHSPNLRQHQQVPTTPLVAVGSGSPIQGAVVLLCLRQVPQQIFHPGAAQRPHGGLEDAIHVTCATKDTRGRERPEGGQVKEVLKTGKNVRYIICGFMYIYIYGYIIYII